MITTTYLFHRKALANNLDESTNDLDWKVKFPTFKTLWKPEELQSTTIDLINAALGTTHTSFNCRRYEYVTLSVRRGRTDGKYSNASFFATREKPPRIGQFERFWELVDLPLYVALVRFYPYETDPINRLPTIDLQYFRHEVIRFDIVGEVVVAAPPLQKAHDRFRTILGNVFYT